MAALCCTCRRIRLPLSGWKIELFKREGKGIVMTMKWQQSVQQLVAPFMVAATAWVSPALAQTADGQAAPVVASVAASPSSSGCAPMAARSSEEMAMLNKLMAEPHRISSLADMVKLLPPGALAKLAEMQTAAVEQQKKDWPNLCRYQEANAQVLASGVLPRVIFLGDSITENWKIGDPSLFNATTLDRGIGGQTTPQILLRFYQDVVALRPRVVHIMAGVNDIMGNTGPASDQAIVDNIRAMIDVAKANGIRVVLAGIMPCKTFVARPAVDLRSRIAAVNRQLVQLAALRRVTYVDYAPLLADSEGGFSAALANDGLHPNRDGYALMRPLTDKAIARAGK